MHLSPSPCPRSRSILSISWSSVPSAPPPPAIRYSHLRPPPPCPPRLETWQHKVPPFAISYHLSGWTTATATVLTRAPNAYQLPLVCPALHGQDLLSPAIASLALSYYYFRVGSSGLSSQRKNTSTPLVPKCWTRVHTYIPVYVCMYVLYLGVYILNK